MKLIRQRDDIPELCVLAGSDPFSDMLLERAFQKEYKAKSMDQTKIANGRIEHKSVMITCHDIYRDLIVRAQERLEQLGQNSDSYSIHD